MKARSALAREGDGVKQEWSVVEVMFKFKEDKRSFLPLGNKGQKIRQRED